MITQQLKNAEIFGYFETQTNLNKRRCNYLLQEAWLSLYCQVLWDSIAEGRRSIAGDTCFGIVQGKLDESYFSES